jgi:hypothetical protein
MERGAVGFFHSERFPKILLALPAYAWQSPRMNTKYPPLSSMKFTNEQIRNLVTLSERVIDVVKDYDAVFPEPKGYEVVEVDATLDGNPVGFQFKRSFC